MMNSPSYLPSGYCSSSASLTANSPMGVVRRPTVNGPFLPRMVLSVSWPGTTMGRTDLVGADVAAMMVLLGEIGKRQGPVRGQAGSERSSPRRRLLPDLRLGLAPGGRGRLFGGGVSAHLGFGRGCVLGLWRLGLRLDRRIDLGTIDLDETDVDQRRFKARSRFPGALSFGADVRINLHVVQTEGDQHLAIPFDGLDAPAYQMLSL